MSLRQDHWLGATIGDRYSVTDDLRSGSLVRFFRAVPWDDPTQPVLVLLLACNLLEDRERLGFLRELTLLSRMIHPNIIPFHELGFCPAQPKEAISPRFSHYLVMNPIRGQNLHDLLRQGIWMGLDTVMAVGIQAAHALESMHRHGIIHGALQPDKVFLEEDGFPGREGSVKLFGFGLRRLNELESHVESEALKAGTSGAPYLAPEVLLLNGVTRDHRSDLYALGAILYELLSGRPPFGGHTLEELVQAQQETEPESLLLVRPELPPSLARMIHKLLAKEPAERFQTACGLKLDLLQLRALLRGRGSQFESFSIGRYDRLGLASWDSPLVGRETEMEQLKTHFQAVRRVKGRSRIMMISAPSGGGKTKLMREFQAHLERRAVPCLSAAFIRDQNASHRSELARALNEYFDELSRSHPEEADGIRKRINPRLEADVIPFLPVIPALGHYVSAAVQEAAHHFREKGKAPLDAFSFVKGLSKLIPGMASEDLPFVMFLDDLHWADPLCLELLYHLASHTHAYRLFVVASLNTNIPQRPESEVLLGKLSRLGRRFVGLSLAPLSLNASQTLLQESLQLSPAQAKEWGTFLGEQSQGHPETLLAALSAFCDKGKLWRDEQNTWHVTSVHVQSRDHGGVTLDTLLERIATLREPERLVLRIAAMLGPKFQLSVLRSLSEPDGLPVEEALRHARDLGILLSGQAANAGELAEWFEFAHRGVVRAMGESMTKDQHIMLSRQLARAFDQEQTWSDPKRLYTLARFYRGATDSSLGQGDGLIERAVAVWLRAGQEALKAEQFALADRYLDMAAEYLPYLAGEEASSADRRKSVLALRAEGLVKQCDFRAARDIFDKLKSLPHAPHDMSYIAYQLTNLHLIQGTLIQAFRELAAGLRKAQHPIFTSRGLAAWRFEIQVYGKHLLPLFKTLPMRVLSALEMKRGHQPAQEFHRNHLLLMGAWATWGYDYRLSFRYSDQLLQSSLSGAVPVDLALRAVCEYAGGLAHMGLWRHAWPIVQRVHQVATERDWPLIRAYALFQEILIIKAYMGQSEDFPQHAIASLDRAEMLDLVLMRQRVGLYQLSQKFFQARGVDFQGALQTLPLSYQSLQSQTHRALALVLLWELLRGESGRQDSYREPLEKIITLQIHDRDCFHDMILATCALVRKERERATQFFEGFVGSFTLAAEKLTLFPYEADACLLFIGMFPELFARTFSDSTGALTLSQRQLQTLQHLVTSSRYKHRAIPLLLRGKILEHLGKREAHKIYGLASQRAQDGGAILPALWADLWRARLSGESLRPVEQRAWTAGFPLLAAIAGKENRTSNSGGPTERRREPEPPVAGEREASVEPLLGRHMREILHVHDSIVTQDELKQRIRQFFKEEMSCDEVHLLTYLDFQSVARGTRDLAGKPAQILAFLRSYLSQTVPVMLPMNEAPWVSFRNRDLPQIVNQKPHAPHVLPPLPKPAGSKVPAAVTAIPEDAIPGESHKLSIRDQEPVPLRRRESQTHEANHIVIPLRYGELNLGLLLLEGARRETKDTSAALQLCGELGAQIGICLAHFVPAPGGAGVRHFLRPFQFGASHLESCSWLDIWSRGSPEKDGAPAYILGACLGADTYLAVYLRLGGWSPQGEEFAASLWHQVLVLRTLWVPGANEYASFSELLGELLKYSSSPTGRSSEFSIHLSVNLFFRSTAHVFSGTWGEISSSFPDRRTLSSTIPNGIVPKTFLASCRLSRGTLGAGLFLLTPEAPRPPEEVDVARMLDALPPSGPAWDKQAVHEVLLQSFPEGSALGCYLIALWQPSSDSADLNIA